MRIDAFSKGFQELLKQKVLRSDRHGLLLEFLSCLVAATRKFDVEYGVNPREDDITDELIFRHVINEAWEDCGMQDIEVEAHRNGEHED